MLARLSLTEPLSARACNADDTDAAAQRRVERREEYGATSPRRSPPQIENGGLALPRAYLSPYEHASAALPPRHAEVTHSPRPPAALTASQPVSCSVARNARHNLRVAALPPAAAALPARMRASRALRALAAVRPLPVPRDAAAGSAACGVALLRLLSSAALQRQRPSAAAAPAGASRAWSAEAAPALVHGPPPPVDTHELARRGPCAPPAPAHAPG